MSWLFVIIVLVVLGAGAVALSGRLGELPPSEQDLRPQTRDGEPSFDVVVRGYRMDEVDLEVASLRAEIERLRGERPAPNG